MKWDLKVGDKIHTLRSIETLSAVRPTEAFSAGATLPQYAKAFGDVVFDEKEVVEATALPPNERKIFENAGWWFVAPNERVRKAAELRERVDYATAAAEVFVNEAGEVLIPTERATVQLPEDMTKEQCEEVLREHKLEITDTFGFAKNMYEVRLPEGKPLPETIAELQESGSYVFVEPNLLQAVKVREEAPQDPHFGNQWHHRNDGSDGGIAGEDLKSIAAWEITKGRGVRIAVIDTGMQIDHPDLRQGIVCGGFFTTTVNGGSVFRPLIPGMTNFPDRSHGTFCMGMAAARTSPNGDNNEGGCGSAPEAELIAIACSDNLVTTQATLARAIHFAVDPFFYHPLISPRPAHIISCSLDTNRPLLTVMQRAIGFAAVKGRKRNGTSLGVPIFWAVDNENVSILDDPVCCLPEVIAVGRYTRRGLRDRGAFGNELAFVAPGVDVYSTRSYSQYGINDGTSFATALAAGVGALILSQHPDWTAAQVREKLLQSCDPVNGSTGHSIYTGHGKLNAQRAVS